MKIVIELTVNEYSQSELLTLLRRMAYCNHSGSSRELTYWCDGDGNSPQVDSVTIDGEIVPINQLPGTENWADF